MIKQAIWVDDKVNDKRKEVYNGETQGNKEEQGMRMTEMGW